MRRPRVLCESEGRMAQHIRPITSCAAQVITPLPGSPGHATDTQRHVRVSAIGVPGVSPYAHADWVRTDALKAASRKEARLNNRRVAAEALYQTNVIERFAAELRDGPIPARHCHYHHSTTVPSYHSTTLTYYHPTTPQTPHHPIALVNFIPSPDHTITLSPLTISLDHSITLLPYISSIYLSISLSSITPSLYHPITLSRYHSSHFHPITLHPSPFL